MGSRWFNYREAGADPMVLNRLRASYNRRGRASSHCCTHSRQRRVRLVRFVMLKLVQWRLSTVAKAAQAVPASGAPSQADEAVFGDDLADRWIVSR